MTISLRNAALGAAAMLGAALAAPLAGFADAPLPGQPGADTSVGQELRGQPYMVMIIAPSGMTTERQVSMTSADMLMQHAKPLTGMMVLMHGDKAYLVENMKMKDGRMLYDALSLPANLVQP